MSRTSDIRLATVIAEGGYHHRGELESQTALSQVARSLASLDPHLDGSTLELARPLPLDLRLEALDLQSGDRLLAFARPPRLFQLHLGLPAGNATLDLRIGVEAQRHSLRASGHLPADEVAQRLLAHWRLSAEQGARLYLLRLLPPTAELAQLRSMGAEFVYTALSQRQLRRHVRLRDLDHAFSYAFHAPHDGEFSVACQRPQQTIQTDIDLSPSFHDLAVFATLSPRLVRLSYQALGDQWSIRLDEQAHIPAFLDEQRLTSAQALPLRDGQRLSIGVSVERPFARFSINL